MTTPPVAQPPAPSTTPSPDAYTIPVLSITNAHRISAKTTRSLALLYTEPETAPAAVGLRAQGGAITRAITIAEILKRRIREAGEAWYQYNALERIKVERKVRESPPGRKDKAKGDGDAGASVDVEEENEKGGGEEEEDPFSPMPDRKVHNAPQLTIYVARGHIPAMAELHGEQTG